MELHRSWLIGGGVVILVASLLVGILALTVRGGDEDEIPLPESDGPRSYARWQGEIQFGEVASSFGSNPHFVGGAAVGETSYFVEANSLSLVEIPASGGPKVRRLALPAAEERPEVGDLEVTNVGTFLLSDLTNGEVWEYALDGRVLGPYLRDQAGVSPVNSPLGLTRDGSGRLLVTDVGDQKVKVFDHTGSLVTSWGGEGPAAGQFSFPNDVVVDEAGRIFVADSNNRRIQVFDKEARFLSAFRETGDPDGLALPRSLALDEQGRLHVADTLNGQVQVFSEEGRFLGSYGNVGADEERLKYPEGLVVRGTAVLVGDRGNGRLVAFRLPL